MSEITGLSKSLVEGIMSASEQLAALKAENERLKQRVEDQGQEIINMVDASVRVCREDRADERKKTSEEILKVFASWWAEKNSTVQEFRDAIRRKFIDTDPQDNGSSEVAMRLGKVIDRLYASEINFWLSCLWDGGIDVKLGDELNGYVAMANVKTAAEAAEWLDREARRAYPGSDYAKAGGNAGSERR